MKLIKVILFFAALLLFGSLNSFAQTAMPNSTNGSATQMTTFPGGLGARKLLKIPVADTTLVFTNVPDSGRITIHPVNRLMYYHNGTSWVTFNSTGIDTTNLSYRIDSLSTALGNAWTNPLITTSSDGLVPLTVQGTIGQTADLQQWRDGNDNVVGYVDKDGIVYGNSFRGASLSNATSADNAFVGVESGGVSIASNKANADPTLRVTNLNGSSSGKILSLNNNNEEVFSVAQNGTVSMNKVATGDDNDSVLVIEGNIIKKVARPTGTDSNLFTTITRLRDSLAAIRAITTPTTNTNLSYSGTTFPSNGAVKNFFEKYTSSGITNAFAWWDFTDSTAITLDGTGKITQLLDKSGNSNTATQTTTSQQAQFVPSGGSNNRAYATFTSGAGGTNYSTPSLALDTNYSIFVIARVTTTAGVLVMLGSTGTAYIGYDFSERSFINSTGASQVYSYAQPWDWYCYEINRQGRINNIYINGTKVTSKVATTTTQALTITGIAGLSPNRFLGQMSEIIIYNRTITQQERENAYRYLSNKYGMLHIAFADGDSWPQGFGQTAANDTRFVSRLRTTYTGYSIYNAAISGSVFTNTSSPVTDNGYARIPFMPAPKTPEDIYIFMYGLNDSRRNEFNLYTPQLFHYQLNTYVNKLLEKGFKPENIVLCTQGVINNGATAAPFNGYSLARYDSFATIIRNMAAAKGTRLADVRNLFGSYGVTYNADPIHMSSAQHDSTARLINYVLKQNYTPVTSVSTSASTYWPFMNVENIFTGTTSTWTLPPLTGNTGYEVRVLNQGTGTITVNSYAGGNDIFSNAAVNTYSVLAGDAIIFYNTGTYWKVKYKN